MSTCKAARISANQCPATTAPTHAFVITISVIIPCYAPHLFVSSNPHQQKAPPVSHPPLPSEAKIDLAELMRESCVRIQAAADRAGPLAPPGAETRRSPDRPADQPVQCLLALAPRQPPGPHRPRPCHRPSRCPPRVPPPRAAPPFAAARAWPPRARKPPASPRRSARTLPRAPPSARTITHRQASKPPFFRKKPISAQGGPVPYLFRLRNITQKTTNPPQLHGTIPRTSALSHANRSIRRCR